MIGDTIVALFDTPAQAELAIRDLMAAGIPQSNIDHHEAAHDAAFEPGVTEPRRAPGFWERLFGGKTGEDTEFYDRSIESGGTVVTVQPPEGRVDDIVMILEGHHPVDMDERESLARREVGVRSPAQMSVTGEQLVNRGGRRVRRYVVEVPADAPTITSEPNEGAR